MVFLRPLAAAADWVGARLYDPDGVLALAAFSSIFKFAGIAAFYPWIDRFAQLIVRISGPGSVSAVSRLDPALADAGAAIALEAAWRAILEVARSGVEAVRSTLAGVSVRYAPPADAVQRIDHFLESLSLETTDLATIGPRLVRLSHALDHLTQLHGDLARIPPALGDGQRREGFDAGARALAAWLDGTKADDAAVDPAIFTALEEASRRLTVDCKAGRDKMLEDLGLQRTSSATARAGLETLAWADGTLYHAWRLAESLRIASGQPQLADLSAAQRS
jgi:phosphate:Na+ symporter